MLKYNGLAEFIRNNINLPTRELFKLAREKYLYPHTMDTFKCYVYSLKKTIRKNTTTITTSQKSNGNTDIELNTFINTVKRLKNVNILELCDILSCPPKKVYELIDKCSGLGFELLVEPDKILFNQSNIPALVEKTKLLSDSNEIIFGVVSDPHYASKACQITAINEFCEIAEKQGVKHIFTPGDILAGFNVYKGQLFDLYAVSFSEQVESALSNIPEGFDWYLMGGNHDYSFIRTGGQNPIIVLSKERDDLHYVGFDEADVPILKDVDLKMWHPSGGVPYSLSYRLQKGVEQIAFSELQSIVRGVKEKPTIRFVLCGHLHVQIQSLFGSIFGMQCGTFEGTTNYLKKLGLVPAIGGYIIKATLGKNGLLKNFEAKFYVFEEIEDDWKNYNHSFNNNCNQIEKPIFEK